MKILCYPDPVLMQPAAEVQEIDEQLVQAAREMLSTMYEAKGIGLAGPQVRLGRRLVVINMTGQPEDEIMVVNPVIVAHEGMVEAEEGCLSFPGVFSKISRPGRVLVVAYDLAGGERRFEAEGLAARVWQHEIDHLDGRLLVDRMGSVARLTRRRALKELQQRYSKAAT